MSKKMQCIKNLKSKVIQMQKQLQRIGSNQYYSKSSKEKDEKLYFNKTTNLLSYSSTQPYNQLPRSPTWKNPTFWGTNPILGKQNQSKSSKWLKNKSPSRHIKRQLSLKLNQVKNFVQQRYYDHKRKQQRPGLTNSQYQQRYFAPPQRYQFSFLGSQNRDTPRFEKIKTYDIPIKNPILQPEPEEEKGKKIIIRPSLSPCTNLTQNPRSNPNVYCVGDKVITLSPKNSNKKNLSPHVQRILSTSLQEKVSSPKRKSCKKHYAKYFTQNFQSRWN